jgi:selenocysteine lyase/cysteine desulfurase
MTNVLAPVRAQPLDIAALRARFSTLGNTIYLNSGSYGLLADSVAAAVESYLESRRTKGADWGDWVSRAERLRAQMAELLNADGDEIAITASASAGMNAVASALDFSGERNGILVSDYEFPTSGQIWHAQEKRGAVVHHIPENDHGVIPVEHFERAIDERTRLVVLSHVCYRHGAKFSAEHIQEIVRLAHRSGAHVLLDSFQLAGTESLDVRGLGVDFVVGGMLKYLLGSAGIGYLYVRQALIDELVPTASGWFAQADIDAMDIHANDPSPTARRFQAGTPPVPNCYAAEAGLDIILGLGTEAIERQVRATTRYALDRLAEAGISIATPFEDELRGPMIAIRASDDEELVRRLMARRIVTSSRDGNLRAGFHFYNDEADVDGWIEALRAERHLLR